LEQLGWDCKKTGDNIDVFLDSKLQGSYSLLKEPYCKRCANVGLTTEKCGHNHSLDGFDRAYAMGGYYPTRLNKGDLLSEHVVKLKKEQVYAIPLGLALAIMIMENYPELLDSQVIIPIPLSDEELAQRGYNQSTELAKVLSPILKMPYFEILTKTRTQGMTRLAWHNRHLAVNGLYEAKEIEQIRGKKVLLLDDVMTTGLTCSEASSILKYNGAISVNVIVVGRTVYSKGRS
jgi:predicted amidophosphoribosyltransferase